MSYFLEVKNRAISSLASDVTDVATTWTLATGEGAKFPAAGDFHVTCENEIVKVTARSTDTLTVVRAQEGTTGAAHTAGKAVELRITAGIITEIQGKKAIAGWTVDKLLKGAGAGVNPTEIDVSAGGYTQGAKVYHSVNQAVANTTHTALAFDSETFDTDSIHDNVTNNSRLTCQTAGKYLITFGWAWSNSPAGANAPQGYIKLNGATPIGYDFLPSVAKFYGVISIIYALAVGDYVEAWVYQANGASINISRISDHSPDLAMQRIG